MSNTLMSKDDVAKNENLTNSGNSNSNGSKDLSGSPSAPRTLQPPSISQLSPSFSSTRQRRHFNGKAPATINFGALTQNTNRIPFSEVDSDTETILRAVTKSQINQSPTLGRLGRSLFNIEQSGNNDNKNDNDDFHYNYNYNINDREPQNIEAARKKMISAIEKVEFDVKKLARAFGASDTMTTFLTIPKNPKFVTNASKTIPHAKDTFDQLERELKHIRIHSKLPKEIKGANTNVLQRLKSMRQAHTSDLSQTFLQNEFQNYISKTEQMSIFNISNKNIKTTKNKKILKSNDTDDLMMIENLKLKAKLSSLQKNLIQKMEIEKKSDRSKSLANVNKPELIIQTQKMLAEIKKKIDLQQNATNSHALQMAEFARKREELIGEFNSSNQQAKRLEIARKRMIDENAKIVTVKGKDYDLKMLDEEINSVFIKTDQIIKNLEKIEEKEKKCLESLKSNY
ncbi:hypothetical protein M9Y10_043679 [Tritrichomonas musculus]|uniref:DUF4201 domain-containing protein n=1 Tax=Tritrichomonas musculus TaxID=1915356 RepID=A0ABR2K0B8_9EUKA